MSVLHAILLGFIQGITEFLPVSSSGHLALTQSILPGFRQPGVLFDVMLHVATMLAVIYYFRTDVARLILCPFRSDDESKEYRRLLLLIIVGSIPTGIIGISFKDYFEQAFHNVSLVAVMLLVTGTILFFSERVGRRVRGVEGMTWRDALITGVVQGLAIIPGISRSGSTIACQLFLGITGEAAARFSFLLALPAVFGAALLSLDDLQGVTSAEIPAYSLGSVVAFVTALLSLRFLMMIIRRRRLLWFAGYCWLVGGGVLLATLFRG